jgi:putative endonuclease
MFTVYVIKNEKNKLYIGQTADLEKRMMRHNRCLPNKPDSFTAKQGGCWKIVYTEEKNSRKEAMKREKELKSHQGREFIKKLIHN